jgi:hypothetical protein
MRCDNLLVEFDMTCLAYSTVPEETFCRFWGEYVKVSNGILTIELPYILMMQSEDEHGLIRLRFEQVGDYSFVDILAVHADMPLYSEADTFSACLSTIRKGEYIAVRRIAGEWMEIAMPAVNGELKTGWLQKPRAIREN